MTNKKKKILFILPSLKAGGAERVLSFLNQEFNDDEFISKLLIFGFENDAMYEYKEDCTIFLHQIRVLYGIPKLLKVLKKEMPSIVMSSIGHVNILMGLIKPLFKNIKFIVRETSVMSVMSAYTYKRTIGLNYLRKFAYKRLDAIVCQSEDMRLDIIKNYRISHRSIYVINNPITYEVPLINRNKNGKVLKIICIGRIYKVKGYDRLNSILKKVKIPYEIHILGDGPERVKIMKSLDEFDNVVFHGFKHNPQDYLKKSDICIQVSYVEGFPNAILLALLYGKAVIAYDVPGGTKELLTDINGFLVEDDNSFKFAGHINNFNKNKFDPLLIQSDVLERFGKKKILTEYKKLFNSLIKV
jgi:glycosyltransferase involved in cell wall biosynthesis